MSVISSVIFYNIVFAIVLYYFKKGEQNISLTRIGLLLLIILAIFRFDIGADYESYCRIIEYIVFDIKQQRLNLQSLINYGYRYEPSFIFIIWLFHKLENTYLYVFATYFLITVFFWYKTLKLDNRLFWGTFAIIVYSVLFITYNQIRQGVSSAIFLYSIHYLCSETKNIKKYILYTLLACLFHSSAFVLFLVIPIAKLKKAYVKTYLFIIVLVYIAAMLGLTKTLQTFIYQSSLVNTIYTFEMRDNSGGMLTMSIYVIIYTFLMYRIKDNVLYANLLFIGLFLYCIASGDLSIKRMSFYFLNVVVIALPYFVKYEVNRIVKYMYTIALIILFQVIMIRGDVQNGCIPYDYIWSKNGIVEKFRIRGYRDN